MSVWPFNQLIAIGKELGELNRRLNSEKDTRQVWHKWYCTRIEDLEKRMSAATDEIAEIKKTVAGNWQTALAKISDLESTVKAAANPDSPATTADVQAALDDLKAYVNTQTLPADTTPVAAPVTAPVTAPAATDTPPTTPDSV